MNPTADPLAALKPIQLPSEPHWFPPAPAWWLLAITLLIAIATAIYFWRQHQRKRAPLKQALSELEQLPTQHQGLALIQALNQLLRRAARQAHGPSVSSLAPAAWTDFLIQHAPHELQQQSESWQQIAQAAYQSDVPEQYGEYIALSRAWLRSNLPC